MNPVLAQMTPFIVMEVLEKAKMMEKSGLHIIHLEVGEPDFNVPECVSVANDSGCYRKILLITEVNNLTMENESKKLKFRIRILIVLFIVGLVLSGVTAFPLETQLSMIIKHMGLLPDVVQNWLLKIYGGVKTTNLNFPFLSYGTDWLAFAHIVIAIAFLGPLKDPVKNIWTIQFGIIACTLVIPLALIAGPIRGIPFYWQLIDCSFGIIGLVPLLLCYKYIKKLEKYTK